MPQTRKLSTAQLAFPSSSSTDRIAVLEGELRRAWNLNAKLQEELHEKDLIIAHLTNQLAYSISDGSDDSSMAVTTISTSIPIPASASAPVTSSGSIGRLVEVSSSIGGGMSDESLTCSSTPSRTLEHKSRSLSSGCRRSAIRGHTGNAFGGSSGASSNSGQSTPPPCWTTERAWSMFVNTAEVHEGLKYQDKETEHVPVDWHTSKKFKLAIRSGIPPSSRTVVWGTVSTATALLEERPRLFDHSIAHTFPWVQDMEGDTLMDRLLGYTPRNTAVPNFGGPLPFMFLPLNEEGVRYTKLLLCTISQNHAHITVCPCLPTLVGVLLLHLEPPHVYAAAKNLLGASVSSHTHAPAKTGMALAETLQYRYLPTTQTQWSLLLNSFAELATRKLSKRLVRHLGTLRVDLARHAEEWFSTLFVNVLPMPLALRIFDCFLLEGSKILIRAALAVLRVLERAILVAQTLGEVNSILRRQPTTINNWDDFMSRAFSMSLKRAELDDVERKLNAQMDFPSLGSRIGSGVQSRHEVVTGLYYRPAILDRSSIITSAALWEALCFWLPARACVGQLEVCFSTMVDGFSLSSLYHFAEYPEGGNSAERERRKKEGRIGRPSDYSILVIRGRPRPDFDSDSLPNQEAEIFGAFLSNPLRDSRGDPYGAGECFVFTLNPTESKYGWIGAAQTNPKGSPTAQSNGNASPSMGSEGDGGGDADEQSSSIMSSVSTSLTSSSLGPSGGRRFMVGWADRLEIGGGGKGPALRLRKDLQQGWTYTSDTYSNAPLCSATEFDIECLELITVRQ